MAEKRGDLTSRVVSGVAAGAAGLVTRKAITTVWKKTTGKEPPNHPEDPDVALIEAIGWAAMMGLAMSIARLLATRVATKRLQGPPSEKAEVPEAGSGKA